jgi:hypothetical protein
MIATIAIKARISAYSARPWPAVIVINFLKRMTTLTVSDEMFENQALIRVNSFTSFPQDLNRSV